MATRVRRRHGGVDRFSELPEGILHHILSFLALKEVKQLSLLSKKWKQVSITHPILRFDQDFFGSSLKIYPSWHGRNIEKRSKFQELLNVVDRILNPFCYHRLNIRKFELHFRRTECPFFLKVLKDNEIPYLFSRIDQWIRHAIDRDVQIFALSIYYFTDSGDHNYILPQCVLLAKSVVTLTLHQCTIPPLNRDFKTNLSSLKTLTLRYVKLSDRLPKNLFSSNLEDFTLYCCHGLKTMIISDPEKLKKLYVEDNGDLECVHIEALTLIAASFRGSVLKVVDIRHCENLRCITMGNTTVVSKWLSEGLTYYPSLETLRLHACDMLEVAKISSTNLKSVKILHCSNLTEIDLDTPNLLEFTYHGGIVGFSSNASALASVSVDFRNSGIGNDIPESCDLKCIEFLSKLNGWGKVNLICSCEKFFIIPSELRERVASPLDDVKKLEIIMTGEKPEPSEELIDSLFWISNHPAIQLLSRRPGYSRLCDYTFKSSKDKTTSYEDEPSRIYFKGFQEMIKGFKNKA